jgi:hypothetical protein
MTSKAVANIRPKPLLHDAAWPDVFYVRSLSQYPIAAPALRRQQRRNPERGASGKRLPGHLNEADSGSAADIHLWVEMYFQAMRHECRPAYRAVIRYGAEANARHPALLRSLLLTGLLRCDQTAHRTMIGRLAPPIRLAADGSHRYRTWLMLRICRRDRRTRLRG